MGTTPLVLSLPAGTYRVGGASGSLRVPSFRVDLQADDRAVILDFGLSEAVRAHAGPGLALGPARRGESIVRAGAWLAADRIVAVSRVSEGDAQFLLGSIYDVRNGALLREGSVRMVAGSVPAANLGALAAFLLTGQSSRDVRDRTDLARSIAAPQQALAPPGAAAAVAAAGEKAPAGAAPKPPRDTATARPADLAVAAPQLAAPSPHDLGGTPARGRWMRPAAYGSAVLVGLFTGFAIHQGLTASQAGADADAMVGPGGSLAPGSDPTRYRDLQDDSRAAARNAYVSGAAAVVFAVTAGVLGWRSRPPGAPPALALRF
jgi:hypothetical protein